MQSPELRAIFRANLRARRRELHLTQAAAAERARITQAYWAQLEAGDRVPQFDVIPALAEALQTQPDALLSREIFSQTAIDAV